MLLPRVTKKLIHVNRSKRVIGLQLRTNLLRGLHMPKGLLNFLNMSTPTDR